jgi:DNA-directed RNA polymerase specialized sigma24 family protein
MDAFSGSNLLWWDRDTDSSGRAIREDVRAAARQVWDDACKKTRALLGEPCEAAGMMEKTVTQVSRYLDRRGIPMFAQDTGGLVLCAFCRALRRYAARHQRVEVAEKPEELSAPDAGKHCTSKADCGLDAKKAASRLSPRGRKMYELRKVGFGWNEVAQMLNTTAGAARAEYSRELKRARLMLAQPTKENHILRTRPCDGGKGKGK